MASKPAAKNQDPKTKIPTLKPPKKGPEQANPQLSRRLLTTTTRVKVGKLEKAYIRENPLALNQEVATVARVTHGIEGLVVANPRYYNLLDEMVDRDPVISSAIELKVAYLMMRDSGLSLPDKMKNDPMAQAVQEWLQEYIIEGTDWNYFIWSLSQGVCQHGASNLEVTWKRTPEGWFVPERYWHCHPGQFLVDRAGNLFLPNVDGAREPLQVPDKKFIRTFNPTLYDNPFGRADTWVLRFLYYFKKKIYLSKVSYLEKSGRPLLHGKVGTNIANDETEMAEFKQALADLLEDDALVTGLEEDVKAIERMGKQGTGDHSEAIQDIDGVIYRYIIGADMVTKAPEKGGARSLGEVQERTVLTRVLPLARTVTSPANQLLDWAIELNFGPNAPRPRWWFDTNESMESTKACEVLKTAKALGVKTAVAEVREKLGLRAPGPEEETTTIGDLGISADGRMTTDSGKGAIATDSPEAKQDKNNPKPGDPTDGGATSNAPADKTGKDKKPPVQKKASTTDPLKFWDSYRPGIFEEKSQEAMAFRDNFIAEALRRASLLSDRLESVALAAAKDSLPGLGAMWKRTRDNIAREMHKDQELSDRARSKADQRDLRQYTEPAMRHVVYASAMLSMGATAEALNSLPDNRKSLESRFAQDEDPIDLLPEGFQEAARWMAARDVMSVAAVKSLAKLITDNYGGDVKETEIALRGEILALAETTDLNATKKVQTIISNSVDKGLTVGEFLDTVDATIDIGEVPGGMDSYWNMVFRTEVGNAYKEQQEANEGRPAFRDKHWGWQAFNPQDKRSRHGHSRVNGKLFKKGGRAAELLGGGPPWAYQCRCSWFALMAPDPERVPYTESGDALAVAAGVERFSMDTVRENLLVMF
jgi:phage gp29-like protein